MPAVLVTRMPRALERTVVTSKTDTAAMPVGRNHRANWVAFLAARASACIKVETQWVARAVRRVPAVGPRSWLQLSTLC
jgi:hypothetical protein